MAGRHETLATMERVAAIWPVPVFLVGRLAYGAADGTTTRKVPELAERSARNTFRCRVRVITSSPGGPKPRRRQWWRHDEWFPLTFWPLPVCDALRADPQFANMPKRMNAV
jgi:hypothetical protein